MKNLSVNRSNLSKENVSILKKLVFGEEKEVYVPETFMANNKEEKTEHKIHDNALGVLYKNLHENKTSRKPLVYFFIGFVLGALSMLFLSAVVLVSDKDTIETDVKTVKESIIETEKMPESVSDVPADVPASNELQLDESGQKIYTVKEGDTLGGIVNRLYGDSSTYSPEKVEKFKEANGLKSIHVLKIGQVLVIPD